MSAVSYSPGVERSVIHRRNSTFSQSQEPQQTAEIAKQRQNLAVVLPMRLSVRRRQTRGFRLRKRCRLEYAGVRNRRAQRGTLAWLSLILFLIARSVPHA